MKNTIWIVAIEPISTRYTGEWLKFLPKQIKEHVSDDYEIKTIVGKRISSEVTTGAFLNFSDTNVWKSDQTRIISEYISNKKIKDGDQIVFTDAWNVNILAIKYMIDLMHLQIKTHGLFHAGSWDPHDFLGRAMNGSDWCKHTEKAMFYAFDHNYFATDFHINLFLKNLFGYKNKTLMAEKKKLLKTGKIIQTGWPFEYFTNIFNKNKFKNITKKDQIVFPHRLSNEKQPEIFYDLQKSMPDINFVVCQEKKLSKKEYHKILAESKLLFSCSLQETLGISPVEGLMLDVEPILPDRLSYTEMYDGIYLYPSKWTESYSSYLKHKDKIIAYIRNRLLSYDSKAAIYNRFWQCDSVFNRFFTASNLYYTLNN